MPQELMHSSLKDKLIRHQPSSIAHLTSTIFKPTHIRAGDGVTVTPRADDDFHFHLFL
jgi:hypothetical protein